jgi:hypothetical protein
MRLITQRSGTAGILFSGLVISLAAGGRAAEPMVVEGHRQLFIDDAGIEKIDGLKRVVNQPTRHPGNPVITGDNPWEKASVSLYGTAIFDEQMEKFRMWYLCTPGPQPSGRKWVEVGGFRRVTNCTLLAYAESKDGVHWNKPTLNQLSFEGSTKNNLLAIGIDNPEGVSILLDLHESDPARRWKAFFWDRRVAPPDDPNGVDEKAAKVPKEPSGLTPQQLAGGMWVAFSPDGIHWKTHGPVLPHGSDTTQTILYDPQLKKYVGFGRMVGGRTVGRTESDDCLKWSEPRLVLAADAQDGPGGQVYGMPTDLYEGLYLGMFWMYREGIDGKIDTQLAVSRNGVNWQRVADRQTFLPNGPDGARDDGMSRVVGRYIARGDTLCLYYSMVNGPHRCAKFPNPVRKFPPAIGLVTLRKDGFVSLDAGEQPGTVLTKTFKLPAGDMYLNADAAKGEVRVALLDDAGSVLVESRPITGDQLRATVAWASQVPAKGTPVRLKITAQNAKLYSYWFDGDGVSTPPPPGAIILFDGKDTSKWTEWGRGPLRWKVENGTMIVTPGAGDALTKEKFADCRLHVEFWVPPPTNPGDMHRGNSGVYLQGRYEIQVIDSYDRVPEAHQCGALYAALTPRVNACKPRGEWQSFDITFHPPKFAAHGKMAAKGRITILQNGINIVDNAEFDHATPGPMDENLAQPGPIRIQNYGGDAVKYRNIWLVPLKGE